jgi:hypothetical protein
MENSKVFVTTYALYNNGYQFANNKTGFWIDCADYDETVIFDILLEQEQKLIDENECDVEIMFTDFEGFPEDLYCESGIDFDLIASYELLDENDQEKLQAILDHVESDFETALNNIEDYYLFDGSLSDYAEEIINDCYDLPEFCLGYFDFDKFGRDLSFDGNITELSHNSLLIAQ